MDCSLVIANSFDTYEHARTLEFFRSVLLLELHFKSKYYFSFSTSKMYFTCYTHCIIIYIYIYIYIYALNMHSDFTLHSKQDKIQMLWPVYKNWEGIRTFRTMNNMAISSRNNTINIQAHIKIKILHTAVVENLQLSKELMLFLIHQSLRAHIIKSTWI